MYMLRISLQVSVIISTPESSPPVSAGPSTSPIFPPIPWKDRAEPRRWEKWWDKAAVAGRCHTDAAIATIPIPTNRTGYTGARPITNQPTPNKAIHTAMTIPQCRRNISVTTPPGRAMVPDTTSRVVDMAPT